MMTVCHIITKLELGGAQQNTLFTVKMLDRQRFRPVLITGSEGILVEDAHRIDQLTTYYVPELIREIRPPRDIQAYRRIRTILQQERQAASNMPCIVHTHSSKAGIIGRWAAKSAGIPYIIHSIHGFGFHPYQSPVSRQLFVTLERLTARITTHFIAVSSTNITQGLQLGLFRPEQVSLIRSGIDIAHFQSVLKPSETERQQQRAAYLQQFQIPSQKKIVGMIACFKPQKAPLDFIRVMRLVADAVPEAHAIMVGDGELRPAIEALIADYRLASTISLLGWRTDIPELLALCQVVVLTSRWEGLPRVCPQAMAVGVPIVATNVDGIPEAVHDGVNGWLVTPGSIEPMAGKIIDLLTHPERARQMGQQGQRMVDEFDSRRMVQQQEELYERLVSA